MAKLGDYLNAINFTKVDLLKNDPVNEKEYVPFIINKSLSYFMDTVILVNEVNRMSSLPKVMQNKFLLSTVRSRKRFAKWVKKSSNEDIDAIMQYYNYNSQKAEQVLPLLSKAQIAIIKSELEVGGLKKK